MGVREQTGGQGRVAARLYVLMARKSPVAVVLRRGPRKDWQMWLWDTARDRFTPGQWYRGLVDVDCCDVSPDGRYVVLALKKKRYSRKKWDGGHHTVVSRPPFFSALAYFPSHSYAWQGGYFSSAKSVVVYSELGVEGQRLEPQSSLDFGRQGYPRDLRALWEAQGWEVEFAFVSPKSVPFGYTGHELRMFALRVLARFSKGEALEETLKALHRGSLRLLAYQSRGDLTLSVETRQVKAFEDATVYRLVYGGKTVELDGVVWAGFDQRGRCLVTKGGQIVLIEADGEGVVEHVLADLNDHAFEKVAPPGWALRW